MREAPRFMAPAQVRVTTQLNARAKLGHGKKSSIDRLGLICPGFYPQALATKAF